MTVNTKNDIVTLQADADKVLCDGYAKTSLGGRVTVSAYADYSVWQEMTEAEADAIIAENIPPEEEPEEAVEEDYIAALEELGVNFNEEE